MTAPRPRPGQRPVWDQGYVQIPLVPDPLPAAEPPTALTAAEAIYGRGPVRAALASTIHDAGCHYCGAGHGSGPGMQETEAATIADAVLAEGYRRVVGDDTTVWTIARTLAGVEGLDISRPDPGADPTPTARHHLALARAVIETLQGGIPVNDAQGNLDDLIRRVEELDNEVAELSDDVVTTVGNTEESVRICGDIRVAIHRLAELLEDARQAGGQ